MAAKSSQAYADGLAVHFIAIDPTSGAMLAGCNFTNIVRGIFQACHLGYSVECPTLILTPKTPKSNESNR